MIFMAITDNYTFEKNGKTESQQNGFTISRLNENRDMWMCFQNTATSLIHAVTLKFASGAILATWTFLFMLHSLFYELSCYCYLCVLYCSAIAPVVAKVFRWVIQEDW